MTVFVDTAYWVARLDKRDQWRSRAKEAMNQLSAVRLVTTELVLVEVLNYGSDITEHLSPSGKTAIKPQGSALEKP